MNISLPDSLKEFVEEQVQAGGYAGASDYMRELLRERRKAVAEDFLRSLIAEGLASGPTQPVTPEYWAEKRRRLEQRRTLEVHDRDD
jgi:antitoxin ParD1/3/4